MTCPIPNTHSRLEEAHRLWHRVADAYEDPEEFRTNLNALIQALRNTTFMLQSEKHAVPEFDSWYETWRQIMREDAVMTWSVGARNRVVKQGDLEAYSTATAGIQASWDAPQLVTFEVPPLVPTAAIAASAAEQDIPEEVRAGGILTVERRWVAADLPQWELLDALAHCFGMLTLLVRDAHRQAGEAMDVPPLGGNETQGMSASMGIGTRDGRPPCMVASEGLRTVIVHLRTREIIHAGIRPMPPLTEEAGRSAAERYGLIGLEPPESADPLDWAHFYMEIAKRILAADKYHVECVFLFRGNRRQYVMSTMPEDQQAKYVFLNDVAAEVVRSEATGLILVADAWWVPADTDLPPGKRPGDLKERREALMVTAAKSDGSIRTLTTPYRRRRFGRIEFEETVEAGGEGHFYLAPILRAWGLPAPSEEAAERELRST